MDEYFHFEELADWPLKEKLKKEKELMGFYISGHPLDEHANIIKKVSNLNLLKVGNAQKGKPYTVIGMISELSSFETKRNETMAFAKLEDLNSSIKLVFFPNIWERVKSIALPESICGVSGKIDLEHGEASMLVEDVTPLSELKEKSISEVHIVLETLTCSENDIENLFSFFTENAGSCELFIHAKTEDKIYLLQVAQQIKVPSSDMFLAKLSQQANVADVWRE